MRTRLMVVISCLAIAVGIVSLAVSVRRGGNVRTVDVPSEPLGPQPPSAEPTAEIVEPTLDLATPDLTTAPLLQSPRASSVARRTTPRPTPKPTSNPTATATPAPTLPPFLTPMPFPTFPSRTPRPTLTPSPSP